MDTLLVVVLRELVPVHLHCVLVWCRISKSSSSSRISFSGGHEDIISSPVNSLVIRKQNSSTGRTNGLLWSIKGACW